MAGVAGSGGRLEVVLDRSWEVQSVTWSNLTWWDPLPCGQELMSMINTTDPLPLPSPALSLLGHPPTPRRKLPPTHLSFRSMSTSPSPIPPRTNTRYSFGDPRSYSSSPLAWPLPPSPDSYNSVFLHSDSSSPFPCTPSSISPQYLCSSPYNYQPTAHHLPTPPDSEGHPYPPQSYKPPPNMFSFSKRPPPPSLPHLTTFTPPTQGDSLLGVPPYLAHIPPPSYY
eukprot:GFUD01036254.1.p1 GENE.GFUD01036254.1~~GFUD01036254.1.p1  ORF type:complete len:225 (-),score=56.04 GFUD01036254.1:128-802(-)